MQVKELLQLTHWVDKNIKTANVAKKYQQLQAILQHNVNSRNNQPQQPFKDQKDDVISTIKDISTGSLTNEQERMLDTLGIERHLGTHGIEKLEEILFKNGLDMATAAAEIATIHQDISNGVKQSDQLKASLTPLVSEDEEEDDENSDVVMRIHFQNEVAMENLSDFKKWGSTWWDIGRGIAMAHDHTPEDIRVVGAQKGSIIIELAVIAAIATTTSTIILSALKVADRVLTIRKKAEEIKSLKLNNKKLEDDLEKEADKEKSQGLKNITQEISISLNINENGDGEKLKVLEKSVKSLIDFVENGGEVDFYADDENVSEDEQNDIEQLKVNFAEIKKLEQRVLAIEHKNS
ncbi:hypothetical protein [Marinomonas aquiplantarum]|uniref:Uncharacterized protein n=1 Tax=Marinomonas aquiplantarum TaxID=491951 RepID=A0A366D2S5_9GAMM|nr:hypothetical protein [Marinomonas aquiplantarum]RBO83819.1 hypothetical protein DFP76_10393 [Marinomonas aquiplantarum]